MTPWIETELKLLLPDESAWRRVRSELGPGPVVVQVNHFFDREDRALATARIAVRVRTEGDRHHLTIKGDELEPGADALSRRVELEAELTGAEVEAALAEGLDLRPWLDRFRAQAPDRPLPEALARLLDTLEADCRDVRLRRQAGFTNRRETLDLELRDEAGSLRVEIALDQTWLPGDRVDYELELELAPETCGATPDRSEPGHAADLARPQDAPSGHARRVERAVVRWLRALGAIEVTPAPSKLARLHQQLAEPRARTSSAPSRPEAVRRERSRDPR